MHLVAPLITDADIKWSHLKFTFEPLAFSLQQRDRKSQKMNKTHLSNYSVNKWFNTSNNQYIQKTSPTFLMLWRLPPCLLMIFSPPCTWLNYSNIVQLHLTVWIVICTLDQYNQIIAFTVKMSLEINNTLSVFTSMLTLYNRTTSLYLTLCAHLKTIVQPQKTAARKNQYMRMAMPWFVHFETGSYTGQHLGLFSIC